MTLKATIASGVETAFAAAEDLVSLGTYTVRRGTSVYDPATDSYTGVGPTTYGNVRMIRTALTDSEREASSVTVSDVKVLIPARDLPVRPNETDVFTLDGVGYNVISLKAVPGDSLWIVFARER